jgi:hypothetical protein
MMAIDFVLKERKRKRNRQKICPRKLFFFFLFYFFISFSQLYFSIIVIVTGLLKPEGLSDERVLFDIPDFFHIIFARHLQYLLNWSTKFNRIIQDLKMAYFYNYQYIRNVLSVSQ